MPLIFQRCKHGPSSFCNCSFTRCYTHSPYLWFNSRLSEPSNLTPAAVWWARTQALRNGIHLDTRGGRLARHTAMSLAYRLLFNLRVPQKTGCWNYHVAVSPQRCTNPTINPKQFPMLIVIQDDHARSCQPRDCPFSSLRRCSPSG